MIRKTPTLYERIAARYQHTFRSGALVSEYRNSRIVKRGGESVFQLCHYPGSVVAEYRVRAAGDQVRIMFLGGYDDRRRWPWVVRGDVGKP